MLKIYFVSMILSMAVSGCFIIKPLKETADILIINNPEIIINSYHDSKYISQENSNSYNQALLQGLNEDGRTYNINFVTDTVIKCNYSIVFDRVALNETSFTETVDDAKSPYHGKSFVLSRCEISAEYSFYSGNRKELIGKLKTYADKSEKLSNNRNAGDYIFGANKDNTEYRYKELDDNIAEKLCEKCGKHIAQKLTRKISKIKK